MYNGYIQKFKFEGEIKLWLTKLLTTVLHAAAAKAFVPAKLFPKATANSKSLPISA